LAFHTYEALSNKYKLRENNSPKKKNEELDDDIDLVSNISDESTITVSGPAGPIKDRKMQMYQEKLDIKLNSYLKKWLVIAIFYEL
jgi:hypothetical protein